MRRTERAAYRTKFYSNLSSPTRFDEEPDKRVLLVDDVYTTGQTIYHAAEVLLTCQPKTITSFSFAR